MSDFASTPSSSDVVRDYVYPTSADTQDNETMWVTYEMQYIKSYEGVFYSLYFVHMDLDDEDVSDICENIQTYYDREREGTTTKLEFMGNHITDAGMKEIGDVVGNMACNIGTLNVEWNLMTDEGLSFLVNAFPQADELEYIGIGGNPVTAQGIRNLAYNMQFNDCVEILDFSIKTEAPKDRIGIFDNPSIRPLHFVDKHQLSEDDDKEFCPSTEYHHHAITDDDVYDIARFLKHNRSVQTLGLCHGKITDKGAQYLADMLREKPPTTNKKFYMDEIDLRYNHIGDEGLKALADAVTDWNEPFEPVIRLFGNPISASCAQDMLHFLQKSDAFSPTAEEIQRGLYKRDNYVYRFGGLYGSTTE